MEGYFRKAIQSVTQEDYDKIMSFRYKDDSLACLAGRLFLRQMSKRVAHIILIAVTYVFSLIVHQFSMA